jgi:hypothetical protein
MNKTEIIQYRTILKLQKRLQEKAIEHGAVVFMDGVPAFFDVRFDNPSLQEIKELIDDQLSVWKRIED